MPKNKANLDSAATETVSDATAEIVFIVDKSGSMGGLESDTIGGFNAMLKEQQSQPGHAVITTVLFDNHYELLHDRIDIHSVAPLTEKEYQVGGTTALLDAIGKTILRIRKKQQPMQKEYRGKALFFIITDGLENASREFSHEKIKDMTEHQKEKHGWEFVFMGANIDEIGEAARIGINADKAFKFSLDGAGIVGAMALTSAISTAFRKSKGSK